MVKVGFPKPPYEGLHPSPPKKKSQKVKISPVFLAAPISRVIVYIFFKLGVPSLFPKTLDFNICGNIGKQCAKRNVNHKARLVATSFAFTVLLLDDSNLK